MLKGFLLAVLAKVYSMVHPQRVAIEAMRDSPRALAVGSVDTTARGRGSNNRGRRVTWGQVARVRRGAVEYKLALRAKREEVEKC